MQARHWWHLASFFAVLILSNFGVYVFYRGFFLQRLELTLKSECDLTGGERTPNCYPYVPPNFQRAIILIVDALKFEFIKYDEKLDMRRLLPYQNKIPIVSQLAKNQPENAAFFRFIADPPTTTMQRLKGLTTGSLPTFSDLSQSFAANAILEDNVISKFRAMGKNITFMGDDTWMSLFPDDFNLAFPFSSFDVKDLDTVDHGVISHLVPEVRKPNWSLLIAHTLGVDHCGHRYGPNHPEMARKLTEVNGMIRSVVNEMGSDTVLFVMGDHGMTRDGDHGGDSRDEIDAGLFIYSPKPFMNRLRFSVEVPQVNFVPTFSLLLGHPIPFSNLGQVIPSLFPSSVNQSGSRSILDHALEANGRQVINFLREYRKVSSEIPANMFDHLESLYEIAARNQTPENWSVFLGKSFGLCQDMWAKFDFQKMTVGLAFVGCSVLCLLVMILFPVGLLWMKDLSTFFAVAISIFHFLSMFSNSFQVEEDFTVMCILLTLLWTNFLRTCQRSRPTLLTVSCLVILTILTRSMELFRRCREEQWECSAGVFGSGLKSSSPESSLRYIRITFGMLLPVAIFMWVTGSIWHSLDRTGRFNRTLKPAVFCAVVLLVARLLLSGQESLSVYCPLIIYGCMIYVFAHLMISPVYISDDRKKMPKSINEIFHTMTKMLSHPGDIPDYQGLECFFGFSSSILVLPIIVIISIILMDIWAAVVASLFLLTYFILVNFKPYNPVVSITIWAFLAWHIFFSTGHQTSFPTLHWVLPEVGLHADSSFILRALIMVLETFPGHVLMSITLPMLIMNTECCNDVHWLRDPNAFFREIWRGALGYLLWNCCKVFIIMFNAAVNRRHLMVWKIFAPRFIFEGVAFMISSVFLGIAYIFSVRLYLAASKYIEVHQVPLDLYYPPKRTKESDMKSSRKKR